MDEQAEEAVCREIDNWGSLGDNENICKLYGHTVVNNENDTRTYILLCELAEEGTIVDFIQKNDNNLVEEQILYIMEHVCKGVKFMHNQSPPMAHRDLKVENVLLKGETFKLADFGSCSTDTLDYETSSRMDITDKMEMFEKYTTLMYRPPEMIDQYLKYPVTCKSDIWMLGCILYTLCFIKHPFFEAQKLAIINAHYYIPDEDYDRVG